jgi:arginine decarboxylase
MPDTALEGQLALALADPKQTRLDLWSRLRAAVDRAEAAAPADRAAHLVEAIRELHVLRPYERLWLYPGMARVAALEERLAAEDLADVAADIRTMARMLSEHGDEAALLDDPAPRYGLGGAGRPHYFTVILVDALGPDEIAALRRGLREARTGETDFVYELLVVSSLEEALLAATYNDCVQACVMALDFPIRAHGDGVLQASPVVRDLMARAGDGETAPRRSLVLAEQLRRLRPQLDLYLMSDESFVGAEMKTSELWNRVFYRYEALHELHVTIVAGVRERFRTPFFDALVEYSRRPVGNFHALPLARGHSVLSSRWIHDMAEFYGHHIFMAESSATTGGLDSLLAPRGSIREAMDLCARAFGSQRTFFVTNGTSTANKIVVQALTRPGDIVLIDRNAHKSHHYGLVLGGADALYLDSYAIREYAFYGGVPLRDIKQRLLELKQAGRLDQVKMLLLTSCTMDGIVYNPLRVMEEVLAIKPDMVFLWDEAWYAFASFHPIARRRTAMFAARELARRYRSTAYREEYQRWKAQRRGGEDRLLPDPDRVRVRVYATHSTHKSLSAFRQGSMIHVWDEDFERRVAEPFGEAFNTHTSTSPNYQIIASLDLARRQAELEGFAKIQDVVQQTLRMRVQARRDPAVQRWLRFLEPRDVVPAPYRRSGLESFSELGEGIAEVVTRAWAEDEFVLDPTRMTLYTGATGIDGDTMKSRVLMDRYGIQVNETSMNRVLMNVTIGVTWGALSYLLDVLRRESAVVDRRFAEASADERRLLEAAVARITTDLPPLPDFSSFHEAFRARADGREGCLRDAFFLTYDDENLDYVHLPEALELVRAGRELVNAKFVVPYPPGFPILVPGQIVTPEAIEFMIALSVKEVHGYRADLGLAVLTDQALARAARRGPPPSAPPRRGRGGEERPAQHH